MHKTGPVMTRFVLGETSFVSRGISHIKITRDNVPETLAIPIRSIGIIELDEELKRALPKPPAVMKTIKSDSPLGKSLGLDDDTVCRVLDLADEAYQSALAAHNERSRLAMLVAGLDMEFVDQAGQVVTDPDAIIEGLKRSGITGHQLTQILNDIMALTRSMEGHADFLSGNGSGSPVPS